MYTVEPPFRKKIYEEYEGMGDDDRPVRARDA